MRRKTRNPRIWFQYACWCLQNWMTKHKPYYPDGLRRWLLDRYDPRRHSVSPAQWRFWHKNLKTPPSNEMRPLPWFVGVMAEGPFVGPWWRLSCFVRRFTGGRSHRCEFTDPEAGALYGHRCGAFMQEYFKIFLYNVTPDAD